MKKKADLAKYRKMARVLEVISTVLFWFGLVVGILTFVGGLSLMFVKETSSIFNHNSFNIGLSLDGLLNFKFKANLIESSSIKSIFSSTLFMASAASLILVPIFRQLSLILGTIKDNKPFHKDNAKRVSIIGITLIIGAFIVRITQAIVAFRVVDAIRFDNVTINFAPDVNMILMGLLIIILAGIFKYGCYLQQEYDSTV